MMESNNDPASVISSCASIIQQTGRSEAELKGEECPYWTVRAQTYARTYARAFLKKLPISVVVLSVPLTRLLVDVLLEIHTG